MLWAELDGQNHESTRPESPDLPPTSKVSNLQLQIFRHSCIHLGERLWFAFSDAVTCAALLHRCITHAKPFVHCDHDMSAQAAVRDTAMNSDTTRADRGTDETL